MRHCQACTLENEWPMSIGAELTVIGKCDECGKVETACRVLRAAVIDAEPVKRPLKRLRQAA